MQWFLIFTLLAEPGVTVEMTRAVDGPVQCAEVAASWAAEVMQRNDINISFQCTAEPAH